VKGDGGLPERAVVVLKEGGCGLGWVGLGGVEWDMVEDEALAV